MRAALVVTLGSLLCACDGGPARWQSDHVPYLLDESMSEECTASAIAAYEFWRDKGVTYIYLGVVPHSEAVRRDGSITVTQVQELRPGRGGETVVGQRLGEIRSARIKLLRCTPWTATHELGHALGLEHRDGVENVMDGETPRHFAIDGDQLDWVRP